MSEELQIGRYKVTINTGERRCGIHGHNTENGRCWECDHPPCSDAECNICRGDTHIIGSGERNE